MRAKIQTPGTQGSAFLLFLRAEPDATPVIIRVRKGLKFLLRCCGLRCVEIREIDATDVPAPSDAVEGKCDARRGIVALPGCSQGVRIKHVEDDKVALLVRQCVNASGTK
jgi:hypothetical protein